MWIKRELFETIKKNHADLLRLCANQEKHISLAHQEILRLKRENQMLKNIKPIMAVVSNDSR